MSLADASNEGFPSRERDRRYALTRTAIYARTSTGSQDTALQLDELRDYAIHRGLEVIDEFVDSGVTSGKEFRPELERMLVEVRRGRIDTVLVWRFDRFARSTRELVNALEEFRTLGVDFISLREAVDTSTPAGRVLFTMIAAVAEFEREIIRERVRAGVAKARQRGKRLGRPQRNFDLELARTLRAEGKSWSIIAEAVKAPVSTIRTRLAKT